jgi:N-acetylglucosaminyldiphosphoundecaprenol N-acetyl-beta-D-mannosaminyltransferase
VNLAAEPSPPSAVVPARIEILGTRISAVSYADVLRMIGQPAQGRAQSFAFCNVHSVMTARREPSVRAALAGMDVATPDGMPLVWVMRRRGLPQQGRVYGPDLMEMALPHGVPLGWRHFFFGATPATLQRLIARAEQLAPGIQIVGHLAPPFRPLTAEEDDAIVTMIRDSGANVVWVGLGMPKQEAWMHRVQRRLPGTTLLGVGAAFDLLSGTVPQAPDWLQDRGLEWAYRLSREPGRLWRRYLSTNPAFVALVAAEEARRRRPQRRHD